MAVSMTGRCVFFGGERSGSGCRRCASAAPTRRPATASTGRWCAAWPCACGRRPAPAVWRRPPSTWRRAARAWPCARPASSPAKSPSTASTTGDIDTITHLCNPFKKHLADGVPRTCILAKKNRLKNTDLHRGSFDRIYIGNRTNHTHFKKIGWY